MSVKLEKGQKYSLSDGKGLSKVMVGLGWDRTQLVR